MADILITHKTTDETPCENSCSRRATYFLTNTENGESVWNLCRVGFEAFLRTKTKDQRVIL